MLTIDKYGVLGQVQPDGKFIEGGDSACWTGHWVYLTNIDQEELDYVGFFEVGFGAYVRHPRPSSTFSGFGAYYVHPWKGCISRDQLTGILVGLIGQKRYGAMLRLMLHHACRGFLFSYNTIKNGASRKEQEETWKLPDITGPDILATELRGFGLISWLFWPLLCVLDLHLLLGAVYDYYLDNEEPDVINFLGKLFVAREHVPTPTSWLAARFVCPENMWDRLKEYWCGWRRNDVMAVLFFSKLMKIL